MRNSSSHFSFRSLRRCTASCRKVEKLSGSTLLDSDDAVYKTSIKLQTLLRWSWLFFRLRVVEAESFAGWTRYAPRVVVQQVVQVLLVFWIRYAIRIRVRRHRVEWQWIDCVAVSGIEVHVFGEAVGVEEIVAGPASRNIRQVRGVEIYRHFIA